MSALGSLVVKLALDYAEYTQGLDRSDQAALKFAGNTQRSFDSAQKSTKEFFGGMARNALMAVGALVGVSAVISRLNTSMDTLAKINDAATKTGATVENLSRIQQAAASFGHTFDPLEDSMLRLSRGMADVDDKSNKTMKALRALGIDARDAAGNVRDSGLVTLEVIRALDEYEDSAEKSRIAVDLWGKSGADLLPTFKDINSVIHKYTGVSKEAAAEADAFQDQIAGVRNRVDEAFISFASDLLPTLRLVAGEMGETAERTTVFSGAAKVAKSMIDQLVIVGAAAGLVFGSLGKIIAAAASQLFSMAKLDFRAARNTGVDLVNDLAASYEAYSNFAEKILTGNEEVVESVAAVEEVAKKRLQYNTEDEGAEAAAKKIAALNDAARKYIETLKLEVAGVGHSAIQIKLLAAAQQAAITPSAALRAEIMEQAQAWARLAQFQADVNDEFAVLQAREDAYWSAADAITEYGRATDLANEAAQFELDLMGKSELERDIAIEQRRAELDLKRQIVAINAKVANTDDRAALTEEAEAIGARARAAARLQAIARNTSEAWRGLWGSVEQTGKMAFTQLLGHGTSSMKAIGAAIKASIIDMLYQLTARRWIISIGTSISGSMAGNAMAQMAGGGGGGGFGAMNALSLGSSLFSALSGGITGGLGAAVTGLGSMFGSSALGAFGAGMGMSTGAAAGAAGAYGAAGMASTGTAISMGATMAAIAGPLAIAAIADMGLRALAGGRVLGGGVGEITSYIPVIGPLLNLLFGKTPKKLGPAELTGDFSAAGFSGEFQADWTRKVGLFGGKKRGRRGLGISSEQVGALNEMFNGITGSIDDFVEYTGTSARSLAGWSFDVRRQIETEEQQAQLAVDLGVSIAGKLAPELLAIQQKGELLIATLGRARAEFALTNTILDMTGQSFGAVGLASLGLRDQLVGLLGGLDNAGAALQPYFDNFYSDAERSASGWRLLNAEMTRLGLHSLPTTRDGFRAIVEAQDLSTFAGQEMFAALIALAPAFAKLTEEAKEAKAALTLLNTDSFTTLVDYTRYIRLAANAGVGPAPAEVYEPGGLNAGATTSANNAALLEELRRIRAEQQAGDVAIALNTAAIAKVLERWEGDGMPDIRDIAA